MRKSDTWSKTAAGELVGAAAAAVAATVAAAAGVLVGAAVAAAAPAAAAAAAAANMTSMVLHEWLEWRDGSCLCVSRNIFPDS